MREDISQQLLEIAKTRDADALRDAAALLSASSDKPLTVRRARDMFSGILRRVHDGEPHAIGARPDEIIVLISLKDLVTLLREAPQSRSFADALTELGFEPVGQRIEVAPECKAPRPTLFGVATNEGG